MYKFGKAVVKLRIPILILALAPLSGTVQFIVRTESIEK